MKNTEKLNFTDPWIIYWRQLRELFDGDEEIDISYNDEGKRITIKVDNTDKYTALYELLPHEKEFGNVKLEIVVIPSNDGQKSRADLMKDLFKNNCDVSRIITIENVFGNPITYVAFQPRIVQYPADNLHDINGNKTTLREELARELLGEEEGIAFCTDNNGWIERF